MTQDASIKQGTTATVTTSGDTVNVTSSDTNGAAVVTGDSNQVNLNNGGYDGVVGNSNTITSQASLVAVHGNSNSINATSKGGGVEIDGGSDNYVSVNNGSVAFNDYSGNTNTILIGQNVSTIAFAGTANDRLLFNSFSQEQINYAFNHMKTYTGSYGHKYTDLTLGNMIIRCTGTAEFGPSLFNTRAYGDDSNVYLQDLTSNEKNWIHASTFTGPNVGSIAKQFISQDSSDNKNITVVGSDGMFVATGAGNDAIDASRSTASMNIIDGGLGSNFITGSSAGKNEMYCDFRYVGSEDIWSSFRMHAGDELLVWGMNKSNFSGTSLYDNLGAAGYTGLTGVTYMNGHYNTFTMTGYSQSDISSGKLSITFGHTADQTGLPGSDYMSIKINW
jgi:hypothetical protein